MDCFYTDCNIYKVCKIKDAAQHCFIHKKMLLRWKDCFDENGQMNLNPVPEKSDEMVDSYDDKQKG